MKVKALQFGKAISAALFVLLLVVVGTKNALAQTSYIVTLQHGDDISTYYGQSAFSEAYNAAISGDIITLSSGTYEFTNYSDYSSTITKAITLRGAGCAQDSITGISPTEISHVALNVPESEGIISIEGIRFGSLSCQNLYNPKFCKCIFNQLSCVNYEGDVIVQNAQFVNCIVFTYYCPHSEEVTAQFINCVLAGSILSSPSHAGLGISNSILIGPGDMQMALVQNSIIIYGSVSPTSIFQNCIGIEGDVFYGQQNSTNWLAEDYSEVFETFYGYSSFDDLINEQFVLKSEVATNFLGTDGTEVGIHGGAAPYKLRPNYMVLKRCNVANQSTIDNKLSVEIEVVSEGE